MMRTAAVLLLSSLPALLDAQTPKPERTIQGHSVTDVASPRLRIQLPKTAKFAGSERWMLFGVADCEVEVFVEAGKNKVVQRYYWIQFEGYLPDKPNSTYDYSSNETRKIDGLDFYIRARFGPNDDAAKPGSEVEHIRRLLQAAGYTLPAGMMNVRLVHLPSEDHRREVMVIFAEDLAPEGVQWQDLMPEGKAAAKWPVLQQTVLAHAMKNIQFSQRP
jgi:hypothetical protein